MAGSLRVNLLRLLIPPVAAILAVGSIAAYYLSIDPAADAYDQSLINTAIAVASDPNRMALAFKMAVDAGRTAFELGLPTRHFAASPTSPLTAFLD